MSYEFVACALWWFVNYTKRAVSTCYNKNIVYVAYGCNGRFFHLSTDASQQCVLPKKIDKRFVQQLWKINMRLSHKCSQ
jgi:hypothetical protein